MSWADIKRRYEQSAGLASQSTEDMTARRILRALKLTEATMYKAERDNGLLDKRKNDTTLLERAIELGKAASRSFYPPPPVIDVKSFKEAEDTVIEFGEQNTLRDMSNPPAVVYRVKGGDSLRVLLTLGDANRDDLPMRFVPIPATLMYSRNMSYLMADCDAQDYFNHVIKAENPNG